MSRWAVRELPSGERLLVGIRDGLRGRVTSPVVQFDVVARTARTESGRLYHLEGEPAAPADPQIDTVWLLYCLHSGVLWSKDVTQELLTSH